MLNILVPNDVPTIQDAVDLIHNDGKILRVTSSYEGVDYTFGCKISRYLSLDSLGKTFWQSITAQHIRDQIISYYAWDLYGLATTDFVPNMKQYIEIGTVIASIENSGHVPWMASSSEEDVYLVCEKTEESTIILTRQKYSGEHCCDLLIQDNITIRSLLGDPYQCIIDCAGAGRLLTVNSENATCRLEGVSVINGNATQGGVVLVNEGNFISDKCIFSNNVVSKNGGVISTFQELQTEEHINYYNISLYFYTQLIKLRNTRIRALTFLDDYALNILPGDNNTLYIDRKEICSFTSKNDISAEHGVLLWNNLEPKIQNALLRKFPFLMCSYKKQTRSITITNSIFKENIALGLGDDIYVSRCNLSIKNSTFSGRGTCFGVVKHIYTTDSSISVNDCFFKDGSWLTCINSEVEIRKNSFSNIDQITSSPGIIFSNCLFALANNTFLCGVDKKNNVVVSSPNLMIGMLSLEKSIVGSTINNNIFSIDISNGMQIIDIVIEAFIKDKYLGCILDSLGGGDGSNITIVNNIFSELKAVEFINPLSSIPDLRISTQSPIFDLTLSLPVDKHSAEYPRYNISSAQKIELLEHLDKLPIKYEYVCSDILKVNTYTGSQYFILSSDVDTLYGLLSDKQTNILAESLGWYFHNTFDINYLGAFKFSGLDVIVPMFSEISSLKEPRYFFSINSFNINPDNSTAENLEITLSWYMFDKIVSTDPKIYTLYIWDTASGDRIYEETEIDVNKYIYDSVQQMYQYTVQVNIEDYPGISKFSARLIAIPYKVDILTGDYSELIEAVDIPKDERITASLRYDAGSSSSDGDVGDVGDVGVGSEPLISGFNEYIDDVFIPYVSQLPGADVASLTNSFKQIILTYFFTKEFIHKIIVDLQLVLMMFTSVSSLDDDNLNIDRITSETNDFYYQYSLFPKDFFINVCSDLSTIIDTNNVLDESALIILYATAMDEIYDDLEYLSTEDPSIASRNFNETIGISIEYTLNPAITTLVDITKPLEENSGIFGIIKNVIMYKGGFLKLLTYIDDQRLTLGLPAIFTQITQAAVV